MFRDYLAALEEAQAINPLRRLLVNELNLPTFKSWAEAEQMLTQHGVGQREMAALRTLVEEIRLFGRKHLFFYRQDSTAREALLADSLGAEDSEFSQAYPLRAKTESPSPILVRVIDDKDCRQLVFTSTRVVDAREELDRGWIREDAPDEVKSAQKIQILKRYAEQAFDVVVIPRDPTGHLEIRIDLFGVATDPTYEEALAEIAVKLRSIGGPSALASPVNLFPAIQKIYDNPDEGRITELAFLCPTEARRREVLVKKRSADDLRKEAYHVAGRQALNGVFHAYRLGVFWENDDNGKLLADAQLILPGTLRTLTDSALYEAHLPRRIDREAYRWIVTRLTEYV